MCLTALALGCSASSAAAFTGSLSGTFINPVEDSGPSNVTLCGGAGQTPCSAFSIGEPGSEVRWGGATMVNQQSGLQFQSGSVSVSPNTPFVLGSLTHINHVVSLAGPTLTSVELATNFSVDFGGGTVLSGALNVPVRVDETSNLTPTCDYDSPGGNCADAVFIDPFNKTLSGGNATTIYTLRILGVSTDPGGTNVSGAFLAQENTSTAVGYIVGVVMVEHAPVAIAGPEQQVHQDSPAGASVQLDGTQSYDIDGDPLTYTWTGPFGTATGATPTVTMPVGTSTATLTVSDGQLSDHDTTRVIVYPPITAAGKDVSGVEGAPFSATMATFTDPDPRTTPSAYAASISWGDGEPATTGTITQPGGAGTQFSVAGTHTYEEEDAPSGPYTVTVKITEVGNAFNTATVTPHAAIIDAPLTGTPVVVTATEGLPFTGVSVGTFTDADPHGTVSDFTATIQWGDGTPSSTGTVSGLTGGTFTVQGGHTYITSGTFTITVRIDDEGGASTTITEPVTVFHAFCTGTLTATNAAHIITGTVSGALNLSGGTWVILNAKVLGAVKVSAGTSLLVSHSTLNSAIVGASGGELIVSDSTVLGAITVESRQPAAVCHSTVNGALAARSGPDGLHVCASTIAGAITVSGSTDLVLIGDERKDCAPNKLTTSGAIVFSDDKAGIDLTGNTLYGSLRVNTSGGLSAARIAGNTMAGALGCDGNTPPPVNGGLPNKAGGGKTGQCAGL